MPFKKGHTGYYKGKHHTEESRLKMSIAQKKTYENGGIRVTDSRNTINPTYGSTGRPGGTMTSWVVEFQNMGPNPVAIQPVVVCAQLVPLVP